MAKCQAISLADIPLQQSKNHEFELIHGKHLLRDYHDINIRSLVGIKAETSHSKMQNDYENTDPLMKRV